VCGVEYETDHAVERMGEFFTSDPVGFLKANPWAHVCTCGELMMPESRRCWLCGADRVI
jgi:hypothetical protein